ncbi:MAG: cell division protein FtsZ [Deltaproteobacteria bacterium]|nr:cell division protein FtsZ [Deltaproteobacteria bacterium]MBW1952211.1 cell division protein FtsZ [Deltaproteobacteria bacterium]MBW1985810.1 cell division protein FtsZ [Deltaproteobacteria bacterium]MBW2133872.1 cell division protein FtsZ [Deltaproteobacteria bacterium]
MGINIQLVESESSAKIKVLGIGGGGGNAVDDMIKADMKWVDFIAANTDAQTLDRNTAPIKIQLGENLTRGLGAGGDPEVGRNATLEDADRLREILKGADMVFIAAGLGGGTGTGGAPIIAEISKDIGALTVAVVTKPFYFEGKRRMRQAEAGIEELKKVVDTLITIPNDRLLSLDTKNTPGLATFAKANEVLLYAVKGISDLIMVTGHINVDFADVRTIMSEMGMALMGTGIASGTNRAVEAAQKAISSPLLEDLTLRGARGILINITSGMDFSLDELRDACSLIQEEAHEDANIIFGWVVDETLEDEARVTVIGTGIGKKPEPEKTRRAPRIEANSPEELEIPTIIRQEEDLSRLREMTRGDSQKRTNLELVANKRNVVHPDLHYEEDELDIPTFMRHQAD